jgi:hypothetical protein
MRRGRAGVSHRRQSAISTISKIVPRFLAMAELLVV